MNRAPASARCHPILVVLGFVIVIVIGIRGRQAIVRVACRFLVGCDNAPVVIASVPVV